MMKHNKKYNTNPKTGLKTSLKKRLAIFSVGIFGCLALSACASSKLMSDVPSLFNVKKDTHSDQKLLYKTYESGYDLARGGTKDLDKLQKGTVFLCRAALADYAPAQYMLGQIFVNYLVDLDRDAKKDHAMTIDPKRYAVARAAALAYLKLAQRSTHEMPNISQKASETYENIIHQVTLEDGMRAQYYMLDFDKIQKIRPAEDVNKPLDELPDPSKLPCTWDDVILASS